MNVTNPDKSSRRRTAVVASLALAGTLLAVPYMAQATPLNAASPAAEQPSPTALLQEQISQAANELYGQAHKDPDTGYSGIVVSVENSGYTLHWKGTVPEPVTSLIETHRKAGLRVAVEASRYTFKELDQRAQEIANSRATVAGSVVTAAGANSDGNSLNIAVAPRNTTGETVGGGASLDSTDTASLEAAAGGIPVTLTEREPATPTVGPPGPGDAAWERYERTYPWVSGSVINIEGGTCGLGFNLIDPNTKKTYMLTAGHCGKIGNVVWNGNRKSTMGRIIDKQDDRDSALVEYETPPSLTGSEVLTGYGMNRVGWSHTGVTESRRNFEGEQNICADGGLMGEVCGGKVTGVNLWIPFDRIPTPRVDEITQIASVQMAGPGDSGGPVYVRTVSGGVSARGVLSGTRKGPKCVDPRPVGKMYRLNCSHQIYVTNLEDSILEHIGSVKPAISLKIYTAKG